MFINFIKVTFRNLASHKVYSAINVLGLAIGLSCAIIISVYILHEKSYDTSHSNSENLYRIIIDGQLHGLPFNGALTSGRLGYEANEVIDVIEEATRVVRLGAWLIESDSIKFNEDKALFTDSNFFDVFDGYKILYGNPETMLQQPRSLVFTEETALRYFGELDILGKQLKVENRGELYTVTGVISNNGINSHINFDILGSLVTYEHIIEKSWVSNNVYTYIKLREGASIDEVEARLAHIAKNKILPEVEKIISSNFQDEDFYAFKLQKITDIHLFSDLDGELEKNSKVSYIYIFGIIAILILIIACFNFINLSTANSVNRAREVMLRKVTGADKKKLIYQFLIESVIFSLIAMAISLILIEMLVPLINYILDIQLQFNLIRTLGRFSIVLGFTVFVGLLAGFYPAYYVSKFDPIAVLNGKLGGGMRNRHIRSVFVVIQFVISVTIIVLTFIIYGQISFMLDKDLGFERNNVMVIRRSDALEKELNSFKSELLRNENILSVSNSNTIPGREFFKTTFSYFDGARKSSVLMYQLFANYDYCKSFGFSITQGRYFNKDIKGDSMSCIINQSAAKTIGLSFPVGSYLEQPTLQYKKPRKYRIVGVIDDYHFQSVDQVIEPLVICPMPGNWEGYINVKVNSAQKQNTISYIEKIWKEYAEEYPFVYFFLNEDFNKNYITYTRMGKIFIVFSILAVFIACMGLFGLIAYSSNQRVREIGIRKALGASVGRLVLMLVRETFNLLTVATIFACALSYFAGNIWLNNFHYRIPLKPIFFIEAVLLVITISMSTVVYQAYRAARLDPGIALKYE